jgi:hypothetical protein
MQLYLDMDGVLADFDAGHERAFGFRPDKLADNVDWKAVRQIEKFYEDLPPMGDLGTLWAFVAPLKPIVLTGVPHSVKEAPDHKRAWVQKHLGPDVPVICCLSREKCRHAKPGDILVDDWEKYRKLWEDAGGRWVTHASAEDTILALKSLIDAGL